MASRRSPRKQRTMTMIGATSALLTAKVAEGCLEGSPRRMTMMISRI